MERHRDGHYPTILPKHSLKWAEGGLAVVFGCDEGSVQYVYTTVLYFYHDTKISIVSINTRKISQFSVPNQTIWLILYLVTIYFTVLHVVTIVITINYE